MMASTNTNENTCNKQHNNIQSQSSQSHRHRYMRSTVRILSYLAAAIAVTTTTSQIGSCHAFSSVSTIHTSHTTLNQKIHLSSLHPSLLTNNNSNNNSMNTRKPSSKSSLIQMSAISPAVAATGIQAITGAITGGFFAGSLHAIAGPDHLAALIPRCCGERWYRAGRIGALWGMGHGLSATMLGVCAFGLKNRLNKVGKISSLLHGASCFLEIAVGVSLILIGVLGIREAKEFGEDEEEEIVTVTSTQKRAVVMNGILHGFSWDGAPSLAPALALATWRGNLSFLLAYAAGTAAAMTITTSAVGQLTRWAGETLDRPDIPQKLSVVASFVAIAVGAFWVKLAFD